MNRQTMTYLGIGGAALAAWYFLGGSGASSAAPAAPAPAPGTADYATTTGQPQANLPTGQDFQSHNPGGFSMKRFMRRHPNFRHQHPRFGRRAGGYGGNGYGGNGGYGGFAGRDTYGTFDPTESGMDWNAGGYFNNTDDFGY